MWKALKFAETVLENVDQTAARVVNKDDDDDDYYDDDNEMEYGSDTGESSATLTTTTTTYDDNDEDDDNGHSSTNNKSDEEKLRDALKYSSKFFTDKTMINTMAESVHKNHQSSTIATTTLDNQESRRTKQQDKKAETPRDTEDEDDEFKDIEDEENQNNEEEGGEEEEEEVEKNVGAGDDDSNNNKNNAAESHTEATTSTTVDSNASAITQQTSITNSSMIEENQVLKSSILHLHEELMELNHANQRLTNKCKKLQVQINNQEKYAKESQDRMESQMSRLLQDKLKTDNDFATLLEEKESQQAQMENKIDELISQLKIKDKMVSDMQEESDKYTKDEVRKRKDAEEKYFELKERYEKLEEKLLSEEEEMKTLRSQFNKREKELLDDKTHLESEFSDVQNSLSEKLQDINRLENLLKMKQSEWQLKDQELQEYKSRATKVLQLRDKQIEELKKKLSSSDAANGGESTSNEVAKSPQDDMEASNKHDEDDDRLMAALDREDMLMDLERLRAENQELNATLDLLKRQQEAENTSSRFKLRNLEKALEREKQNVAKLQQNIATVKISADEVRHKFDSERKELQEELKKRNTDIKNLQSKLSKSQTSTSSDQSEAESRARAMAERLIEKQAQLETLNSEKAALALELEKAKQRIKEVELVSRITPLGHETSRRRGKSHAIDVYDHHDVDTTVPIRTNRVFRSLSERGFLARKFASGLQLVDSISLHSARHLRINPILRILFVLYIFVLHTWVFFILSHTVHILPSGISTHHVDNTPQHVALHQNQM